MVFLFLLDINHDKYHDNIFVKYLFLQCKKDKTVFYY
jgi:hypothetical protein